MMADADDVVRRTDEWDFIRFVCPSPHSISPSCRVRRASIEHLGLGFACSAWPHSSIVDSGISSFKPSLICRSSNNTWFFSLEFGVQEGRSRLE